jgi:hypothetical protein
VSDFITNLARRGAGLTPIIAVQPRVAPPFASEPAATHATQLELDMAAAEPMPEVPIDATTLSSQVRQAAALFPAAPLSGTPLPATAPPEVVPQPSQTAIPSALRQLPILHDLRTAAAPPVAQQPGGVPESEHPLLQSQIQPSSARLAEQPQTLPGTFARVEIAPSVTPAAGDAPPLIRPAPVEPPRFAAPAGPARSHSEPCPIQVRIGTIEVRATTPSAPAPPPAPTPQGFDEYAQVRNYLTWRQD